jgi:hypothetical protein
MRGKWPAYSGKVLSHHGLNLGWVGVWSLYVGYYLLQEDNEMTWMFALAPFFFDIGYWMHYDWFELAGIQGEAQTYIISMGLYCCGLSARDNFADPYVSENVMLGVPIAFVSIAALVKLLQLADMWPYTGTGSKNFPPEYWAKDALTMEGAATSETEFLTVIKMKL